MICSGQSHFPHICEQDPMTLEFLNLVQDTFPSWSRQSIHLLLSKMTSDSEVILPNSEVILLKFTTSSCFTLSCKLICKRQWCYPFFFSSATMTVWSSQHPLVTSLTYSSYTDITLGIKKPPNPITHHSQSLPGSPALSRATKHMWNCCLLHMQRQQLVFPPVRMQGEVLTERTESISIPTWHIMQLSPSPIQDFGSRAKVVYWGDTSPGPTGRAPCPVKVYFHSQRIDVPHPQRLCHPGLGHQGSVITITLSTKIYTLFIVCFVSPILQNNTENIILVEYW